MNSTTGKITQTKSIFNASKNEHSPLSIFADKEQRASNPCGQSLPQGAS
jgi:hypothetical protein